VNLILAATDLRATVWHGLGVLPFAFTLGVALYALNALGLRISMRAAGAAAVVALVPLAAMFLGVLVHRVGDMDARPEVAVRDRLVCLRRRDGIDRRR
jgi:hypothetical protein